VGRDRIVKGREGKRLVLKCVEVSHRPVVVNRRASISRKFDIIMRFLKLKLPRSPTKPRKAVDIFWSLAYGLFVSPCLLVLQSKMYLRYAFSTASTCTAGLSSPSYSAAIPAHLHASLRRRAPIRRLITALWRFYTECKRHHGKAISLVALCWKRFVVALRRYQVAVFQVVHSRYLPALLSALHTNGKVKEKALASLPPAALPGITAPPICCGMTS